ncbi:hypothetical protein J2X67_000621 [Variovorax sp. 3319]|nr:hypothetical protein [Variovorax sp. 3319]
MVQRRKHDPPIEVPCLRRIARGSERLLRHATFSAEGEVAGAFEIPSCRASGSDRQLRYLPCGGDLGGEAAEVAAEGMEVWLPCPILRVVTLQNPRVHPMTEGHSIVVPVDPCAALSAAACPWRGRIRSSRGAHASAGRHNRALALAQGECVVAPIEQSDWRPCVAPLLELGYGHLLYIQTQGHTVAHSGQIH